MQLDILHRIRMNAELYLGCKSLDRLQAFEQAYQQAWHDNYRVEDLIRARIIHSFQIERAEAMGVYSLIRAVAADDRVGFDLLFENLDAVLVEHPEILRESEVIANSSVEEPVPISGFLQFLSEHPLTLLPKRSIGCLRAMIDGYSLAQIERGYAQCADLDGFNGWIRRKFALQGMFRWENVILANFQGNDEAAFSNALEELIKFRDTLGPRSEKKFEVKLAGSPVK